MIEIIINEDGKEYKRLIGEGYALIVDKGNDPEDSGKINGSVALCNIDLATTCLFMHSDENLRKAAKIVAVWDMMGAVEPEEGVRAAVGDSTTGEIIDAIKLDMDD